MKVNCLYFQLIILLFDTQLPFTWQHNGISDISIVELPLLKYLVALIDSIFGYISACFRSKVTSQVTAACRRDGCVVERSIDTESYALTILCHVSCSKPAAPVSASQYLWALAVSQGSKWAPSPVSHRHYCIGDV